MHNTTESKNYLSLIIWIAALIVIGSVIGSSTKPDMSQWYSTLNRSELTPPNYVFPIVWTILYGVIGSCGWLIWRSTPFPQLRVIKGLYNYAAYFKLELDAFVFSLSLHRTFSSCCDIYGYSSRSDNMAILSKDTISIPTYDALFIMDFMCKLLKYVHMVLQLSMQVYTHLRSAYLRDYILNNTYIAYRKIR